LFLEQLAHQPQRCALVAPALKPACRGSLVVDRSGSAAEESPMTRTPLRAALFTLATVAVVIVAAVANATGVGDAAGHW
jgi:hypothetical protein